MSVRYEMQIHYGERMFLKDMTEAWRVVDDFRHRREELPVLYRERGPSSVLTQRIGDVDSVGWGTGAYLVVRCTVTQTVNLRDCTPGLDFGPAGLKGVLFVRDLLSCTLKEKMQERVRVHVECIT